MNVQIKICGLSTSDTIECAIKHGADFIGFIFFEKSPRHLEIAKAAKLRAKIKPPVKLVAVVVNADNATLDIIIKNVKPDFLQLHGNETIERVREIKNRYHLPIIKAFAIKDKYDLGQLADYNTKEDRELCAYFLLDAKAPKEAKLPGGNGIAFDWSLIQDNILEENDFHDKIMLSGGLNSENIAKALSLLKIAAVDISSGIENAAGIKDKGKIKEFFANVQKATNDNKAKTTNKDRK